MPIVDHINKLEPEMAALTDDQLKAKTDETLKKIETGNAPRIPQGDDFTIAPMIEKEMGNIDSNNDPSENSKYLNIQLKKYQYFQKESILGNLSLTVKEPSIEISKLTLTLAEKSKIIYYGDCFEKEIEMVSTSEHIYKSMNIEIKREAPPLNSKYLNLVKLTKGKYSFPFKMDIPPEVGPSLEYIFNTEKA